MILIFLMEKMEKIKIEIKFTGGDYLDQDQFYKFSGSDQDHQKDQVHLKDLDLFIKDQLIFPNPGSRITTMIYMTFRIKIKNS